MIELAAVRILRAERRVFFVDALAIFLISLLNSRHFYAGVKLSGKQTLPCRMPMNLRGACLLRRSKSALSETDPASS
jgi:hypothetical protein